MGAEISVISIRLSKGIVDKIDANIEQWGHFKTKPAFILYAIERIFNNFVDVRVNLQKEIDNIQKSYPNYNTTLDMINKVREILLGEIAEFDGEKVQILLRVPEKLLNDIDEYSGIIGFYHNRNEFITMAIVRQLDIYDQTKEKLLELDKLRNKDEYVDSFVRSALDKIIND